MSSLGENWQADSVNRLVFGSLPPVIESVKLVNFPTGFGVLLLRACGRSISIDFLATKR